MVSWNRPPYQHEGRAIDGLLAMNGLDDLRGEATCSLPWILAHQRSIAWTLKKAIQESIDVYLSSRTYEAVKTSFPYLVSSEFATGCGAVSGC